MWHTLKRSRSLRIVTTAVTTLVLHNYFPHQAVAEEKDSGEKKARVAVERAIEAMGGDAFRNVQNSQTTGRYFVFVRGRKGFSRYQDWTVYDPLKSRFQVGKGDNRDIDIYNLELGKAWRQEGDYEVKEIREKDIKEWKKAVNREWTYLIKKRINEEGMSLFYYGPDDVAGEGKWEAVEFLDPTNASTVIFFNLDTHLPEKVESEITSPKSGMRFKQEVELSNWHTIGGVYTPLRTDVYHDGNMAQQLHVEELNYNVQIPESHFLRPVVKEED